MDLTSSVRCGKINFGVILQIKKNYLKKYLTKLFERSIIGLLEVYATSELMHHYYPELAHKFLYSLYPENTHTF